MPYIIVNIVLLFALLAPSRGAGNELDVLIITAPQTSEVGDVELSEFTGSHAQITRDQIVREQSSLADLIAHEAGIQHRQAGAIGSYSSITVRAATAAQTNIYFDGVLLNNAANGGVDLAQFELLNLESIDVYRGSTPIQLGVGAIGGAVNLRSRQQAAGSTQLLLGLGSFNEIRAQLSRQFNLRGWDTTALVSHVSADNDFEFINDAGTPQNLDTNRREKRNNNEFSRQSVLLKTGKQVSESQRYDGSLQYSAREQAIPDWLNRADTQTSFDTDAVQLQLNSRTKAAAAGVWNHNQGLFFNRNGEQYDDTSGRVGLGTQDTRAETDVYGARSYWEAVGEHGTFALNLTIRRESLALDDRLTSDADLNAIRDGLDVAVQYSLFNADDRLLLAPALRLQAVSDTYNSVVRQADITYSNSQLTPQLGVRWQHTNAVAITGNLGLHHREPVFFELFGDRGLFIGNEELSPDEGVNADIGAHWSQGSNAMANRRAFSVSAFASLRDELIVRVYDSRGIGRSVNNGKARVLGIESTLDWQWNKQWRSRFSLTAQSAINESNNQSFNGNQLPGEAQLVGFASLQYQRGPWRAWYEGDLVQERYYDSPNNLRAEDYFSHSIGASYAYGKLITTLNLKNIGDDNIEDFNGFPKPGRSTHLNVKYTLN